MLVRRSWYDWVSTISSFVVPFKGDLSPSWGVHRDCVGVRGCVRGGYRDSLLETAQEAITIACTRVHRWAQHIWQEKQYFWAFILVLELGTFGLCINCPRAPTLPTAYSIAISRFVCFFGQFFDRRGPSFSCQQCSTRTLSTGQIHNVRPTCHPWTTHVGSQCSS